MALTSHLLSSVLPMVDASGQKGLIWALKGSWNNSLLGSADCYRPNVKWQKSVQIVAQLAALYFDGG